MKAAVLYELNQPLIVDEGIDLPALGRGQVLVKLDYSGVCHSQLMEARGRRGSDRYLPHMLGHEGAGKVVDVGEGVTKVKADDAVVLTWIVGEGIDAGGCCYKKDGATINAGPVTTFSDFAVVSENRLVPLPTDIPFDIAVLFGCAIPTGAGIVMNNIKPQAGQSIAVVGLGGIGLSALLACRLYALEKIIAIDVDPAKLAFASEMGATHLIKAQDKDAIDQVKALTNGLGVDHCVEAAGLTQTIEMGFALVRPKGGRCVFASHPAHGEHLAIDPFELISGKRLEGSWGGESFPDRDIPKYIDAYRQGVFPLDKMLSDAYPLDDINVALADLEAGKVRRALINMQH